MEQTGSVIVHLSPQWKKVTNVNRCVKERADSWTVLQPFDLLDVMTKFYGLNVSADCDYIFKVNIVLQKWLDFVWYIFIFPLVLGMVGPASSETAALDVTPLISKHKHAV